MKQKPFIISGIIGLVVIGMSLILMRVNPRSANELAAGFWTPIIAFEFAESETDVVLILGQIGTPDQAELIDAFTRGNNLDFVYMVLYGVFLFIFAFTCVRLSGNKLFYIAAGLAVLVPIADMLENLQLQAILTGFVAGDDFSNNLARLKLFTWLKWGGLAFTFLLLTPFFTHGNAFVRFIGVYTAVPFVLGVLSYFSGGTLKEIFALSVALMFLLLIVFSFLYRTEQQG